MGHYPPYNPPPPSPWETAVVWTLMAKLVMGTSWEAKLIKVTFWVAYSNEDFTQKKHFLCVSICLTLKY